MKYVILLAFLASPALAGGPVTDYPDDSPCAVPFPSFAAYAATVVDADPVELYAMATVIRSGLCHDVVTPLQHWQALGFTDADILHFVFSGHKPPLAPVPLPPAAPLLAGALLALGLWRALWLRKGYR